MNCSQRWSARGSLLFCVVVTIISQAVSLGTFSLAHHQVTGDPHTQVKGIQEDHNPQFFANAGGKLSSVEICYGSPLAIRSTGDFEEMYRQTTKSRKNGLKKEDVTGSCVVEINPLATADAGHQEADSPTSLLEVHRFHGESQGHSDEEIGERQPAGVED
jgi:hypothetical protein